MTMLPLSTAIFICFLLAGLAPFMQALTGRNTGTLLAAVPAGLFVYFLTWAPAAAGGSVLSERIAWAPAIGVDLSLYLDGLGLLFALLITGIGSLVTLFTGTYLKEDPLLGRFYSFLFLFMGSMLGLVLADNIFLLYIFWELTGISSYFLIGFRYQSSKARAAAWQTLIVTSLGGLLLLVGLVLLSLAGETNEISQLIKGDSRLEPGALTSAIVLLILMGAFTKSAQFPFHFWLPNAMEAPTPVSAYLHSATMVKAGIYLVARFSPLFAELPVWTVTVSAVGGISMVLGACAALAETDLKRILAFTTISSLGICVMLLGLPFDGAVVAAAAYLLAHAMFKGALFLIAGILEHETGSRSLAVLRGLRRQMPLTAACSLLAGLSMAGIFPFLGFSAKELLFEASAQSLGLAIALVIANSLLFAATVAAALRPFIGGKANLVRQPHDPSFGLLLGPAVLAFSGLLAGVFLAIPQGLIQAAASAILAHPVTLDLHLWHGVNRALILSGITILAGAWLVTKAATLQQFFKFFALLQAIAQQAYEEAIRHLLRTATEITHAMQSGLLRRYLMIIAVFILATAGLPAFTLLRLSDLNGAAVPFIWETAAALVVLIGAFTVAHSRDRVTSVAALALIGYALAVFFLMFGAPDLAMTQFAIETLSVILLLAVVYRLPLASVFSHRSIRIRDAVVAAIFGLFMTTLTLLVTSQPLQSRISPYFVQKAFSEGHGRNVVNVILVDFRAMDTLGEITVIVVSAIGVFVLLKLSLTNKE